MNLNAVRESFLFSTEIFCDLFKNSCSNVNLLDHTSIYSYYTNVLHVVFPSLFSYP